ncbi:hypothetical protein [Branchiibius sp. NY16-3462-2]|uniref:hypothetical protein n=1 Tax=Branchiibius sp. NY16-3462-2 TaxID=1807500 RepID=UPI00079B647B|nr:hypothetical protein [Branchiibius sp. NY16-3462-2]KYH43117.1 hypothetical protein AZH51_01315 [Branchiibius sp. NY16-3462-2]
MGQSKRERTWRTPKTTRHVWVKLPGDGPAARVHPHQTPRQGLVVTWRRVSYRWQALVVLVDDPTLDGTERTKQTNDPVVVQLWVDASDLRPVPADPNRAFGLR